MSPIVIARMPAWIGVVGVLLPLRGDLQESVSQVPGGGAGIERGIVQLGEGRWRLSRPDMIRRMTQDFVSIISVAERELIPVYAEGDQLVGYRVGKMQQCAFYRDLGLRDGDIIRSVNGQPVDTLYRMYLQFRTIRHAEVAVERRGRLITLRYWIG